MERINDATVTAPTIHRLVAARVPWPSLKDCRDRRHLRLEWRVSTAEGAELVARTPHPFEDGAAALAAITNAQPGDLPMRANPYRQTPGLRGAWSSGWRISRQDRSRKPII